jgi:hypothetical protein
MQGVLACIDAMSDCIGCLMGHSDVLLVLLSPRSFSERFGAGGRPVHPILRHWELQFIHCREREWEGCRPANFSDTRNFRRPRCRRCLYRWLSLGRDREAACVQAMVHLASFAP